MAQVHNFSFGSFEWFIGVVEDRNDPEKNGRVRVRVFGYYDDVPVADLPWAQAMQPVTSAASAGVGTSPTGIAVGTHVVGFFADGKAAQTPVIMGTLAGKPGGKPDTNELARGDDLSETVVETKKSSVVESRADSNANSALTALQNVQNKINTTVSDTKSALNGVRDKVAAIGDAGLSADLSSISSVFTQIATTPAQAKALLSQVEWQVESVKGQIENLRNLDPEALAERFLQQQVGDVEASIRALRSLDFDGVINTINAIPVAIGQIDRLQDAIVKMGDLSNIVSQVKGLAKSIPGVGAINGIARTISSANVWNEPETPAAPEYPMNKIMETEGGHIEEWDDTPGAERYHRYHPAGSFTEVHPDGTTVDKVVKDQYRVVMGDDYVHIEGKVQVNIVGNSTVVVNGNVTQEVSGDMLTVVKGDYSLAVGGDFSVTTGGASSVSANSQFAVKAARIDLN